MKKVLLLCTAAFVVVALAACAKTLDPGDIEADIEGEYGTRGFAVETVECPDDIEAKEGEAGECTLTGNGVTVPVEISPTDDEGAYEFEIPPEEAGKLEAAANK